MRSFGYVFALIFAVLFTSFAYAGGSTDAISASLERGYRGASAADPVLASFVRDLYREPSIAASAPVGGEGDPVSAIIVAALGTVSDPVLASFVRDLYHDPSAIKAASARGEADPVSAFINALSGKKNRCV